MERVGAKDHAGGGAEWGAARRGRWDWRPGGSEREREPASRLRGAAPRGELRAAVEPRGTVGVFEMQVSKPHWRRVLVVLRDTAEEPNPETTRNPSPDAHARGRRLSERGQEGTGRRRGGRKRAEVRRIHAIEGRIGTVRSSIGGAGNVHVAIGGWRTLPSSPVVIPGGVACCAENRADDPFRLPRHVGNNGSRRASRRWYGEADACDRRRSGRPATAQSNSQTIGRWSLRRGFWSNTSPRSGTRTTFSRLRSGAFT